MAKICKHAFVSGRVQGVWFRAFVREQAQKSNVTGWAKNTSDGRVEVLLCGEDAAVQGMELALAKGPPLSKVTQVSGESLPFQQIDGFTVG